MNHNLFIFNCTFFPFQLPRFAYNRKTPLLPVMNKEQKSGRTLPHSRLSFLFFSYFLSVRSSR